MILYSIFYILLLMRPAQILRDLKKLPKKLLGQNFLVDESVIREMIEAAELSDEDTVVEIGPGLGAITWPLLTHARRVIAIEADREFASYLRLKKHRRLTVVTGDALKIDWTVEIDGVYKIVANIPYSMTSPLLRKIFTLDRQPDVVVLLIQKEMAERIVAPPGSSGRGFLTILVEANAEAKIVRKVKPGSFYPRPRVDAAILVVRPKQNEMEKIFWPAVEAGFRHRRQTLANALSKDLGLNKAQTAAMLEKGGLSKLARAQELSFAHWQRLTKLLSKLLTKR